MIRNSKYSDVTSIEKTFSALTLNANTNSKEKIHHDVMVRTSLKNDQIDLQIQNFCHNSPLEAEALANHARRFRPNKARRLQVTVIGLGPIGSFAAIRAYQYGGVIVGVEKRLEYSRNNILRLTPEVIDQIYRLFVAKVEDIQKLSNAHPLRILIDTKRLSEKQNSQMGDFYTIAIRDLENLLNSWLNTVAHYDPENLKIYRGYAYVENSIQNRNREIQIQEISSTQTPLVKNISSDLIIAADGAKSVLRKEVGIETDIFHTSTRHASFNYDSKRITLKQIDAHKLREKYEKNRGNITLESLRALGWAENRLPVVRFFYTAHLYMGIEVPEVLARSCRNSRMEAIKAEHKNDFVSAKGFNRKHDDMLDTWGRAILSLVLSPEEMQDLILKDTSVIDIQFSHAQRSVDNNPHCPVVLVGEASQSGHFQTGLSAKVGFEEANFVGNIVKRTLRASSLNNLLYDYEQKVQNLNLKLYEDTFHFPDSLSLSPTPSYQIFKNQFVSTDESKSQFIWLTQCQKSYLQNQPSPTDAEKAQWTRSLRYSNPNQLLHNAILSENSVEISLAILHGANVNFRWNSHFTPLMIACMEGNADIVKQLLMLGADFHARTTDQNTVLHWAAESRQINIIQLLIELGLDLRAVNSNGQNVFEYAISEVTSYEKEQDSYRKDFLKTIAYLSNYNLPINNSNYYFNNSWHYGMTKELYNECRPFIKELLENQEGLKKRVRSKL